MILRDIGGHSRDVLQALEAEFGHENFYTWNSYNHGEDWALKSYALAIKERKNIICAETPLIGRSLFNNHDSESYYRIGINIVSSQQFTNFNLPKNVSSDRLHSILENTKTNLKNWRSDGEHIIYAMQVPGDSSLRGLDIFAAAQYDLIQIRQISNRPIIITLHPDLKKGWAQENFKRNNQNFEKFTNVVDLVDAKLQLGGSEEALEGCWCTICYSSGFGFDSLAAGVPVITLSNNSFVAPLCSNSIYEIETPFIPNDCQKYSWLSRVAYCQWRLSEIKSGLFKKHIYSVYEEMFTNQA